MLFLEALISQHDKNLSRSHDSPSDLGDGAVGFVLYVGVLLFTLLEQAEPRMALRAGPAFAFGRGQQLTHQVFGVFDRRLFQVHGQGLHPFTAARVVELHGEFAGVFVGNLTDMRPQQRVEPWPVQYFDRFGDQRDDGSILR